MSSQKFNISLAFLTVIGVCPAFLGVVQAQEFLASANGTVDPITYTTAAGTFTTSPIIVTLDPNSSSYFSVAGATISAHTVLDISFIDGGGILETGIVTLDETGPLVPNPIPMTIQSGTLVGAGIFNGTTLKGENPVIDYGPPIWDFSQAMGPNVFADLPAMFINGGNVPVYGMIFATLVPEPSSLSLGAMGTAIGYVVWRRRRYG